MRTLYGSGAAGSSGKPSPRGFLCTKVQVHLYTSLLPMRDDSARHTGSTWTALRHLCWKPPSSVFIASLLRVYSVGRGKFVVTRHNLSAPGAGWMRKNASTKSHAVAGVHVGHLFKLLSTTLLRPFILPKTLPTRRIAARPGMGRPEVPQRKVFATAWAQGLPKQPYQAVCV
jgi:hypothetical protein